MAVNKLRSNPDKNVSELAKEIVAKWKQDVHQKAKPSARSQDKTRSTASPTTSQRPITPPKPAGKKLESQSKVDPSLRSKTADGVDYHVTGDKTRDNCVGILYDGLCLDSDEGMEQTLFLGRSNVKNVAI